MYDYQLTVRGYELDSYHHVNHAVYLNYMEQARWEIMRDAGLLDELQKTGKKLVVIKLNVRYIREIQLFDKVVVTTQVKKEAPYLVFYHLIKKNNSVRVARAVVKTVLLDDANTPLDIPDEMMKRIELKQAGNG
jgi:acyl-CoA thioester hydrolase